MSTEERKHLKNYQRIKLDKILADCEKMLAELEEGIKKLYQEEEST